MAAAAGVVLAAGTATAAVTQTWPGGDRQPEANGGVRLQFPVSKAGLDDALRHALAVLDRPQAATDRLPDDAVVGPLGSGLQLDSVRRLSNSAGGALYLVPVDMILPKPLQIAAPDERKGPPGICAATTGDALEAFSCESTATLLSDAPGAGGGVSVQISSCSPSAPKNTIQLLGLAVDQVDDMYVVHADGSSQPVPVNSNLIDLTMPAANPPTALKWSYNQKPLGRDLPPVPLTSCQTSSPAIP